MYQNGGPIHLGPDGTSAAEDYQAVQGVDYSEMTADQLVSDKTFQNAATMTLIRLSRHNPDLVEGLETREDFARAAVDRMRWFSANMYSMVGDYSMLAKADLGTVQAFHDMASLYWETKDTAKDAALGTVAAIADPWNVLGFTLLGKAVGRGLSKAAVKFHLRNRLEAAIQRTAPAAVTGAAEGSVWTGVDAAVREGVSAKGEGRVADPGPVGQAMLLGAAAGGLFGTAVTAAPYLARKGRTLWENTLNLVRSHDAADPMATRSGVPRWSGDEESARRYGGSNVAHSEYVTRNPVVIDQGMMSAAELADRVNLPPAALAEIQKVVGTDPIPVDDLITNPDVRAGLSRRGVDLVAYPQDGDLVYAPLDEARFRSGHD